MSLIYKEVFVLMRPHDAGRGLRGFRYEIRDKYSGGGTLEDVCAYTLVSGHLLHEIRGSFRVDSEVRFGGTNSDTAYIRLQP